MIRDRSVPATTREEWRPTGGSLSSRTSVSKLLLPVRRRGRPREGSEGRIGYFRRNHFFPVPEVSSLTELDEVVEHRDRQDDARRIDGRPKTVAERSGRTATADAAARGVVRDGPDVHAAGRPLRPDPRPHHPLLGSDPLDRQTGPGCFPRFSPGVYDQNVKAARHERLTPRALSGLSWTTTWRSWSASPKPSPEPPPSNRHGLRASAPPSTTHVGTGPQDPR